MSASESWNNDNDLQPMVQSAIDAVLQEVVADDVLHAAIDRAVLLEVPATREHSQQSSAAWGRFSFGATASVCAVVAAVVFFLLIQPFHQSVLADVADAIAARPWMHIIGQGQDGQEVETWFSERSRVFATRQGSKSFYTNINSKTIDVFDHEQDASAMVLRAPLTAQQLSAFESGEEMLLQFLVGNPGGTPPGDEYEVVSHTQQEVHDGDTVLIEHQLTTIAPNQNKQSLTVLRVDPKTQLPVSWKSVRDGVTLFSCRVEFPGQGPQSIYGLGVPPDTEVVDQTGDKDLPQILEALKNGRTKFDAYRAIVVQSRSDDHHSSGHEVLQVWRNGLKWRIERLRQPTRAGDGLHADTPPKDSDAKLWWLSRSEHWEAVPKVVSDGIEEIQLEPIFDEPRQPDPKNPRHDKIVALKPKRTRAFTNSPNDPRPTYSYFFDMPGFAAYPHLYDTASWSSRTTVINAPSDGPTGCLLIESTHLRPSKMPGRIRGSRSWHNPQRGFVMEQRYWPQTDVPDSSTKGMIRMEQLTTTPNGLWYPEVMRVVGNSVHLDTGEVRDSVTRFYVDFDVTIPDEMFNTRAWGSVAE